jgi:hypothetical protein
VNASSRSHLVLIPSYNTGSKVYETVREARRFWAPVWVVVDGSTDGTAEGLQRMAAEDPHLRVVLIPSFMQASQARPDAMILGKPVFDASAPLLRVYGRRLSNGWTNLETLGAGIGDSLFGFRVYPIGELVAVMQRQPWMRRFDFDTEAAVRLAWRGVAPVNMDAPVKYLRPEDGGVTHFKYLRDNALLTWMHARLLLEFALRLPVLLLRRLRGLPPFQYLGQS